MAWKAKLISVPETNHVATQFDVQVLYYDSATGREFERSVTFHAGVTLESAQAQVARMVEELTELDNTKAALIPFIGQDVA